MSPVISRARDAWQRLYSKHGMQYGGSGDLRPLLEHIRQDMLVLDAGCGDGKSTEILAGKAEVVGCDFSREALMTLRSQRDRDSKVNLVECNIMSLPFESEKFDAIACIHTLSHLPESERAKAGVEVSRVLKPSGYLMVEGFGRSDLRFGEGTQVEDSSYLRGNGIMTHYFQEGELPSLFGGLQLISEVGSVRRVSYGAKAGKRDVLRVVLQKP
jgi:SAM-dependent methyltransferase